MSAGFGASSCVTFLSTVCAECTLSAGFGASSCATFLAAVFAGFGALSCATFLAAVFAVCIPGFGVSSCVTFLAAVFAVCIDFSASSCATFLSAVFALCTFSPPDVGKPQSQCTIVSTRMCITFARAVDTFSEFQKSDGHSPHIGHSSNDCRLHTSRFTAWQLSL